MVEVGPDSGGVTCLGEPNVGCCFEPLTMGDGRSSKSKRSRDKDGEHSTKKKHKSSHRESSKKHRHSAHDSVHITDDDPNDDDMWVEKNIDIDGEGVCMPVSSCGICLYPNPQLLAKDIPTAESLKLTLQAQASAEDPVLPPTTSTETKLQRDEWMLLPPSDVSLPSSSSRPLAQQFPTGDDSYTDGYAESSVSGRTLGGAVDFFSSLGTEKKRKPQPDKPDPDKVFHTLLLIATVYQPRLLQPKVSDRELNVNLREGSSTDARTLISITPGGPGSSWRMMRLRRVYETAEEENRPVEEVGLERFGTMQAFEEAKEERRILDEREGRRSARRTTDHKGKDRETAGEKRFTFTDIGVSGASSRSSTFRRPTTADDSAPTTPSPAAESANPRANRRLDSLRLPSQAASPLAQSHTPIPSVMTPSVAAASTTRAISPSSLNRLQAQVLRAKLMNAPNATELEEEYEEQLRQAHGEPGQPIVRTRVEVLPTLDARGRLYDVGHGEDDAGPLPGNRKKREKVIFLFTAVLSTSLIRNFSV